MAVLHNYNLTVSDILDELPTQATTGITATSAGINTSQIQKMLDRVSGLVISLLTSKGVDSTALNDDEIALAQEAVISHVVGSVLAKLQRYDDARIYFERHKEALKVLRERPEELGAAGDVPSAVASNIDPDNPSPDFWGKGFSGF